MDTSAARKVKTEAGFTHDQSPVAAAAAAVAAPLPPEEDEDAAIAVDDVSDDEGAAAAAAPATANTQARPAAPGVGSITIQRTGQVFNEFQPAIDAAQEGDVLVGRGRMVVRGQLRMDKRWG